MGDHVPDRHNCAYERRFQSAQSVRTSPWGERSVRSRLDDCTQCNEWNTRAERRLVVHVAPGERQQQWHCRSGRHATGQHDPGRCCTSHHRRACTGCTHAAAACSVDGGGRTAGNASTPGLRRRSGRTVVPEVRRIVVDITVLHGSCLVWQGCVRREERQIQWLRAVHLRLSRALRTKQREAAGWVSTRMGRRLQAAAG